jgi:excisionase family DNA binding protein
MDNEGCHCITAYEEGKTVTRLIYNETEARQMLGGLGRSKLYQLIANGSLTPTKIGRRTFFAADELERFVGALKAGVGV